MDLDRVGNASKILMLSRAKLFQCLHREFALSDGFHHGVEKSEEGGQRASCSSFGHTTHCRTKDDTDDPNPLRSTVVKSSNS